ncbi:MAG TPA: amidohydrolase [Rhizomicrobium sp.]|nr:amidohydrolase [Rhizomicrobium sp.]
MRLAAALAFLLAAGAAQADDLILKDGAVYTLDPARPWAQAVVVRDGRIAFVGSDAGAAAFAQPHARTIALDGRMVLPGFHDAHVHPMSGGLRLLQCRLEGLNSAAAVDGALRVCAAAKGQWLQAIGLSPGAFGPAGPSRAHLDAIVPGKPAFLRTEDGFTAWANSRALTIAGIDARGPDDPGIVRDPKTHKPTGLLRDNAVALVRSHIPRPAEAEYREALRRTTSILNRYGVTSIFDAACIAPMLEAYRAADDAHELTVRVVAAQLVDPSKGPPQVDDFVARRARLAGPFFRADAAKIFLDGEIDRHTAALLAPYADRLGERGSLFVRPGALKAIVRRLDAAGFLIHFHAMGDGAVREGLDAYADAIAADPPRDRRNQIAHVGVADPTDIPRFARLGVTANFQPLWFPASDPAAAGTETALGPVRARWIMPIAAIARAGGRIVAGSDWPATDMNPLDSIQAAITRQPLDGSLPPRQPEERMTLPAMLAAYTRDAAWVVREDGIDGTVTVGRQADLIVLDKNLFALKPGDIHHARVLLTLLAGKPVWRDPTF